MRRCFAAIRDDFVLMGLVDDLNSLGELDPKPAMTLAIRLIELCVGVAIAKADDDHA